MAVLIRVSLYEVQSIAFTTSRVLFLFDVCDS